MQINVETVGQVAVVTLSGHIDSGTAAEFEQQVLPLAHPGQRILVDMAGVTYMSSAGLRVLLLLHRQLSEFQGHIVLAGLRDEIRDIMSMTGFLDFFVIYADRTAAMQYFDGIG